MRPRALFLAPHNDDETLFGAFTLLAWHPDVIVCFLSDKQRADGIESHVRSIETGWALKLLGGTGTYMQSSVLDTARDDEAVEYLRPIFEDAHEIFGRMAGRDGPHAPYDVIFAPAVEDGGHEQHSLVGDLASRVFGERVVHYLTYRRGYGRSSSSVEVPFRPEWPALKLAAMSMYRSQSALPSTAPWFMDHGLREFYVEGTKAGMYAVERGAEESPARLDPELLRMML